MNRKQIEQWGYEADNRADVVISIPGEYHPDWQIVRDEYFASLVAAHEREQCAVVCEDQQEPIWYGYECPNTFQDAQHVCAKAIRARNNQESK